MVQGPDQNLREHSNCVGGEQSRPEGQEGEGPPDYFPSKTKPAVLWRFCEVELPVREAFPLDFEDAGGRRKLASGRSVGTEAVGNSDGPKSDSGVGKRMEVGWKRAPSRQWGRRLQMICTEIWFNHHIISFLLEFIKYNLSYTKWCRLTLLWIQSINIGTEFCLETMSKTSSAAI